MLHIAHGLALAGSLESSGIAGEIRGYGDLLYDGPAPAGLSDEEWRESRARFNAEIDDLDLDEARTFEDALAEAAHHEEVCLWVDHSVKDQLLLVRVLDWFRRRGFEGAKLNMVCVGRHPRLSEDFRSLDQLLPSELAALLDQCEPVETAHLATAAAAWTAFTAPDPTAIEAFLKSDNGALPFLRAALRRHLEEFPDVRSGLSRSERLILTHLRDEGL